MKYYDGMGKDVSDYVAGLEQAVAELKAKLELLSAPMETLAKVESFTPTQTVQKWDRNDQGSGVMFINSGSVETTEVKPKPRRRTEPDANTE
jgi:hypothetical protein